MALTDTAVRNAKPKSKPYKITDGQGLYLLVNPGGSKLWRVKYRLNGVERKLALGPYPEITLAEARSARDAARKQVAHAVDSNAAKIGSAHVWTPVPNAHTVCRLLLAKT